MSNHFGPSSLASRVQAGLRTAKARRARFQVTLYRAPPQKSAGKAAGELAAAQNAAQKAVKRVPEKWVESHETHRLLAWYPVTCGICWFRGTNSYQGTSLDASVWGSGAPLLKLKATKGTPPSH